MKKIVYIGTWKQKMYFLPHHQRTVWMSRWATLGLQLRFQQLTNTSIRFADHLHMQHQNYFRYNVVIIVSSTVITLKCVWKLNGLKCISFYLYTGWPLFGPLCWYLGIRRPFVLHGNWYNAFQRFYCSCFKEIHFRWPVWAPRTSLWWLYGYHKKYSKTESKLEANVVSGTDWNSILNQKEILF